jgi:hypothetical protein
MIFNSKKAISFNRLFRTWCALAALFPAAYPAFAENTDAAMAHEARCYNQGVTARGSAPIESTWLPKKELFQPLLADPKQPRFFVEYQRVNFETFGVPAQGRDDEINAAFIGLGGDFGLWSRRAAGTCNGVQVGLFGGVFSAFNMDTRSDNLINTDFIGGAAVTHRNGPFSTRVRLFHQSSHLGDELILTSPTIDRVNFNFEQIDALLSYEHDGSRFYGGAGYLMGEDGTGDLDPWKVQLGAEYYGPRRSMANLQMRPVLGADFKAFEEQEWTLNSSLVGGIEWFNPQTDRGVRLLLTYLHGFSPYGQFFTTEQIRNVGVEMQFVF